MCTLDHSNEWLCQSSLPEGDSEIWDLRGKSRIFVDIFFGHILDQVSNLVPIVSPALTRAATIEGEI